MTKICILSGLEIPKGQLSTEHFLPRVFLPPELASHPNNLYPAIKVINNIKGALYPCEWIQYKDSLCWHAYVHYNLKQTEKEIILKALMHPYEIHPCDYCIGRQWPKYCLKQKGR